MALARVLLAALVVALSLSGCDWFEKSKKPLPGERIPVMQDRRDIEPDKDAASIQVTLPGPNSPRRSGPARPGAGPVPPAGLILAV